MLKPSRIYRGAPTALILGVNEIASAVAAKMHEAGFAALMSHDPDPPVIRRGMSFFDALFDDSVTLGGLSAVHVEDTLAARAALSDRTRVVITRLQLNELMTIGGFDVLIDARMQKYVTKPDLRHLACVTAGLGPGFTVDTNCDVAIETKPGLEGRRLEQGVTLGPDRTSRKLGGLGRERFAYSERAGVWRTALDVGTRVFKGITVGMLEDTVVVAPMDGVLRGIARDGTKVSPGVKLIEIDPRGRNAAWAGYDDRGTVIAEATCLAVVDGLRRSPRRTTSLFLP